MTLVTLKSGTNVPKNRIEDDKMSAWSRCSIDRTCMPRQQLQRYVAQMQTLCLISALPLLSEICVFLCVCVCAPLCQHFIWIKVIMRCVRAGRQLLQQCGCNHRLVAALKSDNDGINGEQQLVYSCCCTEPWEEPVTICCCSRITTYRQSTFGAEPRSWCFIVFSTTEAWIFAMWSSLRYFCSPW